MKRICKEVDLVIGGSARKQRCWVNMKAQLTERMKELTFKFAIETYTKGKRHHHIKKTLICVCSLNGFHNIIGQI